MDNNVDISHLPTPDELTVPQSQGQAPAQNAAPSVDISHLPTPDELETPLPPPIPEGWSKAQSFGQGALQGATLGFSDELGGALGAIQEKLAGNPDNKSLQDLYKEYRDFQRSRNQAAEDSNKKSYMVGNILGGVGSTIAAPEALAAQGTSVAGAAGLGAATGLGTSNAPLISLQSAINTGIGAGLGAVGGLIGKGLSGATTQDALENTANSAVDRAVGIKPSKELTTLYDPDTGQILKGSNITKKIGLTGLREGALPFTGGPAAMYDKSLEAIDTNYQKLNPILNAAQQSIDQDPANIMEAAGPLSVKAEDFMDNFEDSLEKYPNRDAILQKIQQKYQPYIEKIIQSDGDINQLNAYKKQITDYAQELSSAAYDNPASDLKPEAAFVKQFGGVLRSHIEDLANAADEGLGDQIHNVNNTLGNLYYYNSAAQKLLDKPTSGIGLKDAATASVGFMMGGPAGMALAEGGKLALETGTGNTLGRLANIATAKAANLASKAVQTPAGDLAQKAISNLPLATITNPFTQDAVQNSTQTNSGFTTTAKSSASEASKIATNLYNATDDSLKDVADTLSKSPTLQYYGKNLNDAIDNNDSGEKNRAIFLIMQNPAARALVTPTQKLAEQGVKALSSSLNRS